MKMQEQKRKMLVSVLVVVVLSFVVRWSEKNDMALREDGSLLRKENGKGGYEAEVILTVDETEETEWVIIVPEQSLTKKEEEVFLAGAVREIEAEFAGENASLESIRDKVVIRNQYQDGKVTAEWEFSNHRLITDAGVIEDEMLANESEIVEAKVCLMCEDSMHIHEFCFIVCKRKKSEEEQFYEKLNQLISENSQREGAEILWLPTDMEGHSLVWENKESHLPIQIFFLGMMVVMLFPALDAEREKEARKKKEEQLSEAYPELVNKLALLLGAGMTLQGAWRRITAKYVEHPIGVGGRSAVVYEEMLITQREIESGQGEARAYAAFGERCGLPKYRKLSGYLAQSLKKGNHNLCEWLEQEASDAFAERKSRAQQYVEEAGTKLLFPMLLMLGIVIFVIMVPAVISFQSGV